MNAGCLLYLALCFFGLICAVDGFTPGQRLDALVRVLHNQVKTQWADVQYSHLPVFAREASTRYVVPALVPFEAGENEFKIQFSIAENRLAVPWVDIYDANSRRKLDKLTLTFTHDDVDVLQVRASTSYTAAEVDESTTELEFTFETRWKRRVTEDVTTGVHTMCFLSVLLTIGVGTMVAMAPADAKKQHTQQPRQPVDRNKERFD